MPNTARSKQTNITTPKHADEAIHTLLDALPQLVWIAHPDGSVIYNNQRLVDYLALTLEQVEGNGWMAAIHPEDLQRVQEVWQTALQTGMPFEVEYRLQDGNSGAYHWFLVRGVPQRNGQGAILHWVGTCTDIDEQKRIEQQLNESRENWRVLAEAVPQLVWTIQPNGHLEYVNQRYRDWMRPDFKLSGDDFWRSFVHPDDIERTLARRHQSLTTGEPYENEYRLKNSQTGTYHWFLTRGLPVRDKTGHIIKWVGTSTDIDEQKRIEEALRQSQERVSALMNSSIIGIVVAEEELVVDANDTMLRMTGYTREDLRAGRMNWMQMTPPEYRARTLQAQQELDIQHAIVPYEKEFVCKDGSHLPVVVGWVRLRTNPSQVIGFILDNSAHKELDQRKDDFINMASHELRNPLTALKLQVQLARRRLQKQSHDEAVTALSSLEEPIKQLERLIGELLDVSKIQAGKLEYRQGRVDLNELLREIVDTLQYNYPDHSIVVRAPVRVCMIGDRDRLGQVFTNLISNAIKYSPQAKTVEVEMDAMEDVITVRVRDHGLGIPREQCEKIFERFYRVASPRQKGIAGLGMGLYIVARIVKDHEGTITVDSEVGKGSTFTVTLPNMKCAN
jgi:PAS domain S-box-containing protein